MDVSNAVTGRFQQVRWVPQTGSTNADIRPLALATPDTAQVLFTDEQTAGRGRHQRTWTMRSGGGVMVSFYVPWLDAATAHGVNTALAIAVVDAIAEVAGTAVTLKWPNDVIVDHPDGSARKLAGILAEVVSSGSTVHGVIAGLGLNVSWPAASDIEAHEELAGAASLDGVADAPVDREALAASIVSHFEAGLAALSAEGVADLHTRYHQHSSTVGRRVRVERNSESSTGAFIEGVAVALDPSGGLIIDVDGQHQTVLAGDVVHLRAAPEQ